jgi:hypothetical protein
MSIDIVRQIPSEIKQSYDLIPYADWCGEKGKRPAPYKLKQTYPDDHQLWAKASDSDRVGIRLNNLVLVDYDGNKPEAVGEIPSTDELATALGFTSAQTLFDECLVQWNSEMTSLHFFFIAPPEFNVTDFKQSNSGTLEHFWKHIDIKTGNQLCYLKESKTALLRASDSYPTAPSIITDQLKRETTHVQQDFDSTIKCSDHQIQLAEDWLHIACDEMENTEDGGRNATLNTLAVTVAGLVAGGALDSQASHTLLFDSAMKAGCERSEVIATLESAWTAGFSTPRRDAPYIKPIAQASEVFASQVVNNTNINVEADTALTMALESGELDADNPDIGILHAHYTYFRDNWVMNTQGRYIDKFSLTDYNKTSFDALHHDRMPVKTGSKSFKKHKASDVWEACNGIVVADLFYMPGGEDIVEYERKTYLNAYYPYEPKRPAQAEIDRITLLIKSHLCWLFEDIKHQHIILDWLAWQVQHTGELVGWLPLLMGCRGDGKSILFQLVTSAVGSNNTKMMGNKSVNSDFQDWAKNSAVTAFEEIKVGNKDSRRVANDMKPFITEKRVTINPKGTKEVTMPNFCNYIAFTNEPDPISVAHDDRRWFILETQHFGKNTVTVRTQTDMKQHFDDMMNAVNLDEHAPAVHWALRDHVISDEFVNNRFRAPQTKFGTELNAQTASEKENRLQEYLDNAHFSDGRPGRLIDHVDGFQIQDFRPVMPDNWWSDNKKPSSVVLGKWLRNLGYEHAVRHKSDGSQVKSFKRVGV